MIFSDFRKALNQIGDARFLRVMILGAALALALLVAVTALFLGLIERADPGSIVIPLVGPINGPINGLGTLLSWGGLIFMLVLSAFLMMPVAAVFSGLFLDDVAQAVEDRHYPDLPGVARARLVDSLIETTNFVGLLIVVNGLCLLLYAIALPLFPLIPLIFWGANGLLLGHEYFTLVATRRLGRAGARALRRRYFLQVWLAGCLMAAALSIPLVNLIIPVLGVATFTHMVHRLAGRAALTASALTASD